MRTSIAIGIVWMFCWILSGIVFDHYSNGRNYKQGYADGFQAALNSKMGNFIEHSNDLMYLVGEEIEAEKD